MKLFVVLVVLVLMLVVWAANKTPTSNPVSSESAASQQSSADSALQQAQQQQAEAGAAAVSETAQAQAADRAQALAATATAQVADVARARLARTAEAEAMLVAQQRAEATATVQAQFAQQVVQANEAQATLDARAVLLAQQQVQMSATDQAMFVQQAAQANEAQATLDARAVLVVQQQAQTTATAEAMQRAGVADVQAVSAAQQQSAMFLWFIPLAVAVVVFGLTLVLGAKYIGGLIDGANERRSLENQKLALLATLFKTHNETLVFIDEAASRIGLNGPAAGEVYDPDEALERPPIPIDDEAPPALVILSNGDPRLPDRAEAREEAARCKLAMKLLRDAIGHTQMHSNRIPSAGQLGWPARAWAIAVAILRPYGVETLEGSEGGTYLVGAYATLQAVYIALGERRLNLYPPTAEDVPGG
jgi:hypothetical protein